MAWGSHLDREIEAVKQEIEVARLDMQRAMTRNVMGSLRDNRGQVTAEADDLEKLMQRLKQLEEHARKEHAAQKRYAPGPRG